MKPVLSCGLVLCFLLMLAACGGSSSTLPPPNPNNVGFNNASLNGSYVFRVSGSRIDSTTGLPAIFSAVGVFVADGSGHITSGQQDTNDTVAGLATQVALTGTYTIGVDGRGQAVFNYSTGSSNTFDFVLNNVIPGSLTPGIVPNGRIIGFSSAQVATGRLEKQNTALASVNGTYILRLDGWMPSGSSGLLPISSLGALTINGASGSATLDQNLNGTYTAAPGSPVAGTASFTAGGVGRGTITNLALSTGTTNLVFYAVNSSRLEFLQTDASTSVIGGADVQTAAPTVSGNYVFVISGLASFGNMAEAGQFSLSGGTLSNGLEDIPGGGSPISNISGTYSSAASGRLAGSFTSPGRQVNFVMWFSDSNHGVLMTTNNDLLETGLVQSQPAIPGNSTVNGNYALNLSGAAGASLALTGQVLADGVGAFTGLEDFDQGGGLASGRSASGSYSFASNGRGTGTIGGTSVVLYPADGNTIFVLTSDGNVVAGMLQAQH